MEIQSARKKLETLAHASQELKNTYERMDDNLKQEFQIGYDLDIEFSRLAEKLFHWSETQFDRKYSENE
ncbi:hypothetical protein [Alkalicoccus halolimnae]|jgi:conjugal transfer/entry exclusion protein|uniref:Uncharacterized protein n=1 Tax=Alkalicoccus halolimnae TaxID=1667239 RepID=A0A5C7FCE7_9BACI|nr:hypothetical protein [Alkalicoccus halolimnae]TXF87148.1 hypothetical protein FTX54_00035 [Alkalicoccus halolimnae]